MLVRQATINDVDRILELFNESRAFMRSYGNKDQWPDSYPNKEIVLNDIKLKQCFVCEDDNKDVIGTVTIAGPEAYYNSLFSGKWLNEAPYVTIHRIATGGSKKGAGKLLVKYTLDHYDNVRGDTHELNTPMQQLFLDFNFKYVGVCYLDDGIRTRLCYHYVK